MNCRNGHPWADNTGTKPDGTHYCLGCLRDRQSRACRGCKRFGLYLVGPWCSTCQGRIKRGVPLDTPIRGLSPKGVTAPRKPQAKAKPPKAPKGMPTGWLATTEPQEPKRPGDMARSVPELGAVDPLTEAQITGCREVLAWYNALDLADVLGVAS